MMMALASLVGLGYAVCGIMVLIKQFQLGGAVQGIIGLLTCGLWTFIWGWMNAGKHNLKNLMLIWTILFVVYVIVMGVGGASMFMAMRQ